MRNKNMTVESIFTDGLYTLTIIGECDASSSIVLNEEMEKAIAQNPNALLVDCNQLEYISSPGLGVFTSIIEECKEKNIVVALYGMTEDILRVFSILGLDQLLAIFNQKEDALAYARNLQI